MTELEQPHNPEDIAQQPEQSFDVTSLKKIDMSREDYDLYTELDPDDPRVAELLSQHNIAPGEAVIVSAIDLEHPENNILRVVATGEDSFTTNRSLTNELEARLLDTEGDVERIAPNNDIDEELGELAVGAAGVEAPVAAHEQEVVPEQALLEAKSLFDQRLNRLSTDYIEASNHYKNAIKTSAEVLSAIRNQLEESSEAAFKYLRSGLAQPDRINNAVTLAIEELSRVNRILGTTLETIESSSTASGSLSSQAETHKNDVGLLHGEFRVDTGRIMDDAPELDHVTLGQVDTDATEATTRQTVNADSLKESALEVGSTLRQIEDDTDAAQQRTRSLSGRLEDIKTSVSRGQLISSEYESIVQSAKVLAQELQDNKAIRRLAALAEEL